MVKTQQQRMSPRLYSFDFTALEFRNRHQPWTNIEAERLDRMIMAHAIPPIWAFLVLCSSWAPERLKHKAVQIITAALPLGIRDVGAQIVIRDLASRANKPKRELLQTWIFPEAILEALVETHDDDQRVHITFHAAIELWNFRLRHGNPTVIQHDAYFRQRCVEAVCQDDPDLDRKLLDQNLIVIANEAARAIERHPELAERPIQVPDTHDEGGVHLGPEWALDERGFVQPAIYDVRWANDYADNLVRKTYKHVRRNLLGWGYRQPRVKLPRDEIEVTAQRRQRRLGPRVQGHESEVAPSVLQASDPAALYADIDLLQQAMQAVDSPAEQEVLQMLIEGLSPAEIAQALNAKTSAIYKRIERLRRKLASMLR